MGTDRQSAPPTTDYTATSILLHWIGAVLVIALFVIGQMAEDLPRAERLAMMQLHYSIGMIAFVVLGVRILWRLRARDGASIASSSRLADQVAIFVKVGLLLTLAVLIVTGPLTVWTNGRPIDVFGVLSLPSPFARNESLHEVLGAVHVIFTKVIVLLVALHLLGTLKHLVIDRDGAVRRIFIPGSSR